MEIKDKLTELLLIVLASFFAAFSAGLTRYTQRKTPRIIEIVADVLSHGISGAIIGMLCSYVVKDMILLMAVSAIGGMIGTQLVHFIVKILLASFAASRGVALRDLDAFDKMDKDEIKNDDVDKKE